MIRQAQSYFNGAASSAALIAAAIVAFVVVAWFSVLRDFPLPSLGGASEAAAPIQSPSDAAAGAAATALSVGGRTIAISSPRAFVPPRGSTLPAGPSAAPAITDTNNLGGNPPSDPSGGYAEQGQLDPSPNSGGRGPEIDPGSTEGGGAGSPAAQVSVSGALNNTVSGLDQATGGVLGHAGVTGAVGQITDGLAGPGTPLGQTLNTTVGGLLGTSPANP